MDVTNINFVELLPEINETIQKCDFIAIDTELSGLMRERSLNIFDLPNERFAKSVDSSRGYFIMQFGLSCFTRTSNLKYSNRTYNFYIFPQAHASQGDINRTFSLQAHAIQFLTEHGFDFNKLFKHGVSYLTFQEKKSMTAQLKSEMKARSRIQVDKHGLPKFVPSNMQESCQKWLKSIKKFVNKKNYLFGQASEHGSTTSSLSGHDQTNDMILDSGDSDRFELRECYSNYRRAIFRRVLECQPFFENIEVGTKYDPEKNENFLVVNYIDKVAKEEKQKNAMIVARGFLEVLEIVILYKKPLVGHNLFLDLIQIINQFIEPLTDAYDSFKGVCHELFPLIYDTKFIAHSILDPETLTNNQSRLNDLYCQLRGSETLTKITIDQLGRHFDDEQLPHQAGYDAYMSGYCFLVLCENHMKEKKKYKYTKEDLNSKPISISQDHQIVNDFANKIHLSYSYDFKYLDLNGEEQEPDRDHVFYVEYPPTWTMEDLFQLFQQWGGVQVGKLSKTSSLCALRDPKNLSSVLKKVKQLKESPSIYSIFTYDEYLDNYKVKKKKEPGDICEDVEFIES